jgi:hypothetical protein
MAGEEWNCFTLKQYVDAIFSEKDKAVTAAVQEVNARLNALNEAREQRADEIRVYLPREEFNRAHEGLIEKVDALTKQVYIVVGSMAVVYLILHFLGAKP